jgi:hypothetical protein
VTGEQADDLQAAPVLGQGIEFVTFGEGLCTFVAYLCPQ